MPEIFRESRRAGCESKSVPQNLLKTDLQRISTPSTPPLYAFVLKAMYEKPSLPIDASITGTPVRTSEAFLPSTPARGVARFSFERKSNYRSEYIRRSCVGHCYVVIVPVYHGRRIAATTLPSRRLFGCYFGDALPPDALGNIAIVSQPPCSGPEPQGA